MHVSFLGGTGTVTGSKYLVEAGGRRILVDCGMFQGLKELRLRNRAYPGFDPPSIDAVVVTHAHLDHSGWLPVLVRDGFTGPIYATAPATALCEILLIDSGHLQEEDARFANKHGFSKHSPALPLYTEDDARVAMTRFHPVPRHRPIDLGGGVTATFLQAGHMLGASMVRLDDGRCRVLFSGDLGRPDDLLLEPPETIAGADFAVIESTYGDRRHGATDPEPDLIDIIQRTSRRGGAVIVPSFCIGRAQQLLLHIGRLRDRGAIPDLPVYLDSPMAAAATRAYAQFRTETRLTPAECTAMCETPHIVASVEESKRVTQWTGPMVVIAGSGMATGGRVLHHLKAFAPDHRNTILFSGYQAIGTRGADIVAGARQVKIHGEMVPIRAEVAQLDALSAHSDYAETIAWLRGWLSPPERVYLTHGEPSAAQALAQRIGDGFGWPCSVPQHGDQAELTVVRT